MPDKTSVQPRAFGDVPLTPNGAAKGLDSGLRYEVIKRTVRNGHEYRIEGEKAVRVSEILSAIIAKGGGFDRYLKASAVEGMQSLVLQSTVAELYQTASEDAYRVLSRIPEDYAARDRGTIVHKAIEEGVFDLHYFSEEIRPYITAAGNFFRFEAPQTEAQEQVIGSRKHGYAGTLDWRGKWGGNRPTLIDFKTANKAGAEPYSSYHLQLALYELASREMGHPHTDGQYVVMLYPDATYRAFPCKASIGDANFAIRWFKSLRDLEERMKA